MRNPPIFTAPDGGQHIVLVRALGMTGLCVVIEQGISLRGVFQRCLPLPEHTLIVDMWFIDNAKGTYSSSPTRMRDMASGIERTYPSIISLDFTEEEEAALFYLTFK